VPQQHFLSGLSPVHALVVGERGLSLSVWWSVKVAVSTEEGRRKEEKKERGSSRNGLTGKLFASSERHDSAS